MKLKLIAMAALAAFATACASTPEEPVETTPTPTPVVDPTPTPEPVDTGPVPGTIADFVENAGDRVFFGYDRHDLTPEARAILRDQAAWLASYPAARIRVEGNCDERGTREYNLALGSRRANAARDYLVSQGVDPSRITTVSYGKERPSCTQSSESCWMLNRNSTSRIIAGVTN